ncbi:MAG: ParB/RepB/Spo0J family partition protein [Hyphomicrobiales bacterium]|nr:ParB/RepB/Spo0J family partition protein [Hyphomicrobiales bacterium]MCY4048260.1 ParB/RepB/Spo0J family partition protein [Hyphomicrobiales bacterium]
MVKQPQEKRLRGLGKGLAALLGEESWRESAVAKEPSPTAPSPAADGKTAGKENGGVRQVPIEFLTPNSDQPRKEFSQTELKQLAHSIHTRGVLQPILVRPDKQNPERFEIVAGERRWRAAQICSLHQVPVIVHDLTDAETLECALIENIQRAELNPIEEAAGYEQLIEKFGHTQEQLAQMLSKSRSHITNLIRLLKLPPDIRQHIAEGTLTPGHGRALVGQKDVEALAEQVISLGLNVRQTENHIKQNQTDDTKNGSKVAKRARQKSVDLLALEKKISEQCGMRVNITEGNRSNRGRVTVTYRTIEQFEDICARLKQPPREFRKD